MSFHQSVHLLHGNQLLHWSMSNTSVKYLYHYYALCVLMQVFITVSEFRLYIIPATLWSGLEHGTDSAAAIKLVKNKNTAVC